MVSGARGVDLVVPMMRANQGFAVNLLAAVAQAAPAARVVLAGSIEEKTATLRTAVEALELAGVGS